MRGAPLIGCYCVFLDSCHHLSLPRGGLSRDLVHCGYFGLDHYDHCYALAAAFPVTLSTVATSALTTMTTAMPSPLFLFLFPLSPLLSGFMMTFSSTFLAFLLSLLFLFLFLGRWIFRRRWTM